MQHSKVVPDSYNSPELIYFKFQDITSLMDTTDSIIISNDFKILLMIYLNLIISLRNEFFFIKCVTILN